MPFDAILISDVSIDEFLKIDEAQVICDINKENCKICFDYAQKIPVAEFKTSLGGNSANVAAGMAKLGLKVAVFSQVGNDQNGSRFINELKKRGVDTSLITQINGETDIHSIIIYKGERTILSYHSPKIYQIQNWEEPKWIYYSSLPQGFQKFQQQLIDYLNNHKSVLCAFNPGVYHFKAGFKDYAPFLQITDLLFVNKEEAMQIIDQAQNFGALPERQNKDYANNQLLHETLQRLGPKMTVITDGENGASVHDGVSFYSSDIYKIDKPVIDKTGAGDAFASAFLSALIYKKSAKTALDWGVKNASYCIREIGPMNGLLSLEEIEKN